MTITATVPRNDTLVEAGDVGSTTRNYSFEIFDEADLEVTVESGGVITGPLTVGVDYTVAGVGNDAGGSITLIGAYSGGLVLDDRWAIVRKIVKSRSTDFQTAGPFLAATVNDQFDRVFASIQEHQEALDRRLGFKDAVADLADEGGLLNLTVAQRASQFLSFDSLGNLVVNSIADPDTAVGVDETDTDVAKNKLLSNNLAFLWEALRNGTRTAVVKWKEGADLVAATTVDLSAATGNSLTITGNTKIDGLGTVAAGTIFHLTFSGTPIIDHSATNILQGSADLTMAAGNQAIVRSEGGGTWRWAIFKADGTALVVAAPTMAFFDSDFDDVTIVNSTSAATLYSVPVPANTLGTGKTIQIHMAGTYKNNSAGTRGLTLNLILGTTTISTNTNDNAVSNAADIPWTADFYISNSGATNTQRGNLAFRLDDLITNAQFGITAQGSGSEDTTGALTLKVEAQHGFAHANLSITKTQAVAVIIG